MNYINTTSLEYPVSLVAIRQRYPDMSITEGALEIPGFAAVAPTAQPVPAVGNKIAETAPVETTPGVWQQQWLEVPLTQAEIDAATQATISVMANAVQRHIDATARQRNYDGILSACSYVASTNPQFSAEGIACVAWRDAVWATCYQIMGEVQAGTRAIPTEAEIIVLLPAMVWPA